MGPFEMVVAIVGIGAVASVMRARHGIVRTGRGRDRKEVYVGQPRDDQEAERLRGEVRSLKDRVQVLEAIVTDGDRNRSLALEREIEALRDHRAGERP